MSSAHSVQPTSQPPPLHATGHDRLLSPAQSDEEALALTRRLATGHYENFSVVSLLLPKRLRQDFCNLYAFCRIADDLGDSAASPEQALADLGTLRNQTLACYAGRSDNALFTALRHTITAHDIPAQPFLDLIDAFEQDQRITRYDTSAQLVDYCRRSANPVGRLVLYACGYRDEPRQRLSDQTCTGLQIINFCQDVRRDLLDLGRIYIPAETLERAGTDARGFEAAIRENRCPPEARRAVQIETDRSDQLFTAGQALFPTLAHDVRGQIRLFTLGGQAVVRAIRKRNYDTLTVRPSLGKRSKAALICRTLISAMSVRFFSSPPQQPAHVREVPV